MKPFKGTKLCLQIVDSRCLLQDSHTNETFARCWRCLKLIVFGEIIVTL